MRPFYFALPLGALLDLLLGDPRWALPHPVVLMGRAIAFLEKIFRRILPKTPGGELAGSAYYFGKLVEKPTIGDALRPIQPEDIPRVGKLMFCTSFCCLLLCLGGRLILWGGIL